MRRDRWSDLFVRCACALASVGYCKTDVGWWEDGMSCVMSLLNMEAIYS